MLWVVTVMSLASRFDEAKLVRVVQVYSPTRRNP